MPEKYSQILDLAKIDVFHETEKNDNTYFEVTGLPQILSYVDIHLLFHIRILKNNLYYVMVVLFCLSLLIAVVLLFFQILLI